ncbi:hypothetical protein AAFF_G00060810 [Aldrovandia affinis]|uniref:Uncharacterized protein n=1 Tax=Aldrovandia affinis TaxID=143900 RepID=A0AAD7WEU5_9TELE|nr:hypothetical protein AAFF_G00060810 [Aldrovandia affinis]
MGNEQEPFPLQGGLHVSDTVTAVAHTPGDMTPRSSRAGDVETRLRGVGGGAGSPCTALVLMRPGVRGQGFSPGSSV